MGFNRKKGISTGICLILLAAFNFIAFLTPSVHDISFWIGYGFTTLASVMFLICMLFFFNTDDSNATFLRLPTVKITWIYLILQTALGLWQILTIVPYTMALIINSCLTGLFVISVMLSHTAAESISEQDKQIHQKILYIKDVQLLLSGIKTDDKALSQKIETLIEDVKYSDPMSHSMLSDLEGQIEQAVMTLKADICDTQKANKDVERISDLIKERNQKCKMLKNTPEPKKAKDNSGVKHTAVAAGIIGVLASASLIVCFIVVPTNTYNTAKELYEKHQYEKAIAVFKELNGFKDSNEMINTCETSIKDEKYNEAKSLFENKKYDEAIKMFKELDTFKDSKDMIENINTQVKEEKYNLAEKSFANQDYTKASKLYKELGDYKDCVQKLEQIKNRLSTGSTIYYGTYKNNPIEWQIIETSEDKMLLIAKDAVCELPYNNAIKNVSWKNSSLNKWLNNDFLTAFSKEQQEDILSTKIDSSNCKVFLLSQDEAEDLEDESILQSENDWWLRTKSETNAIFVTKSGSIEEDGKAVVISKGVRPCIWLDLK